MKYLTIVLTTLTILSLTACNLNKANITWNNKAKQTHSSIVKFEQEDNDNDDSN
jgi:hypothetical protein